MIELELESDGWNDKERFIYYESLKAFGPLAESTPLHEVNSFAFRWPRLKPMVPSMQL